MVAVCPHLFPMSFAHCLVAIAGDKSQEQDGLGRACLATMCELGSYLYVLLSGLYIETIV